MDFAQLILSGRLVRDPETTTTKNGTVVTKFTVATNRRVRDEEKTSYIPVTVFGGDAVNCGKYLSQGREVLVTGTFETDSYVDGEGVKRKGFGCIAREVVFGAGGRKNDETDTETETETRSYSKAKAAATRSVRSTRGR